MLRFFSNGVPQIKQGIIVPFGITAGGAAGISAGTAAVLEGVGGAGGPDGEMELSE